MFTLLSLYLSFSLPVQSISVERTFREISKPAELREKCKELSAKLAEDVAGRGIDAVRWFGLVRWFV